VKKTSKHGQNEVFSFKFFAALQSVSFAFFAAVVPLYADLFGIRRMRRRKIRRLARNLAGRKTYITLSTFLQRGLRPFTVNSHQLAVNKELITDN
jgi:hypothetical protein